MPRKGLVLIQKFGNHSNRLFQALHLEAFCLEHGIPFSNPSFFDMAWIYGIPTHWYDRLLAAWLLKLSKWGLLRIVDLVDQQESRQYQQAFLSAQRSYVKGWSFRVPELTEKYRETLSHRYRVKDALYLDNELYQRLLSWDRSTISAVGVHIRRGDYKTWQDGRYCFSDEVYQGLMDTLAEETRVKTGKSTKFIIFSNEETSFVSGDNLLVSRNPWYVDHVLLGHCDLIFGPPSTFTAWASYTGGSRFCHIESAEQPISLGDFHRSRG